MAVGTYSGEMVGPSKLRHSKATIPKAWCPLLAHMALLIVARYKSLMLPGPGIKMVLFRKKKTMTAIPSFRILTCLYNIYMYIYTYMNLDM